MKFVIKSILSDSDLKNVNLFAKIFINARIWMKLGIVGPWVVRVEKIINLFDFANLFAQIFNNGPIWMKLGIVGLLAVHIEKIVNLFDLVNLFAQIFINGPILMKIGTYGPGMVGIKNLTIFFILLTSLPKSLLMVRFGRNLVYMVYRGCICKF